MAFASWSRRDLVEASGPADREPVDRAAYAPIMARWWTVAMLFVSAAAVVGLVVFLVG